MLKQFKTIQENRETAVVTLGDEGDFIKIRPISFGPFQTDKSLIQQKFKIEIKKGLMTEDQMSIETGKLVAKHLVIDWQITESKEDFDEAKALVPGLKTAKKTKDTPEGSVRVATDLATRTALLTSPHYAEFLDFIVEKCREKAVFCEDEETSDAGN